MLMINIFAYFYFEYTNLGCFLSEDISITYLEKAYQGEYSNGRMLAIHDHLSKIQEDESIQKVYRQWENSLGVATAV